MTHPADFDSIPVIDIAPLYQPDLAGARAVADAIRRASIEAGFFYIKGHTVPPDLLRASFVERFTTCETSSSMLVNSSNQTKIRPAPPSVFAT